MSGPFSLAVATRSHSMATMRWENIPGLLAVALLTFGIREIAPEPGARRVNPARWESLRPGGVSRLRIGTWPLPFCLQSLPRSGTS